MTTLNGEAPFRKTAPGKVWKIARQKYRRLRREVYQLAFCRRGSDKRVLLVMGCQRSGTTLIGNVLAKDLRSAVLQEHSCITRGQSLRLKPYGEVNRIIQSLRAPLVVAKPLVECQWTSELLQHISGSRALWMFRNYGDVVRSNVKRFNSQIEGLRMAVSGSPPSWRNERLSSETHSILRQHFSEDMRREDAAALGWYARNVLFFEIGLDRRDDVLLCKYEDLVSRSDATIDCIYRFMKLTPPRSRISGDIDSRSIGLGDDVKIKEPIRVLCDELWDRLINCHSQHCQAYSGAGQPDLAGAVERGDPRDGASRVLELN